MRIGRENGKAVRRRDEHAVADHHVAVAVAIRCRAEIRSAITHDRIIQGLGVDKVGVRVMAAEIFQRREIQHRAFRRAKAVFEDFLGIGAGDRAHRVERNPETGSDMGADRVEIEKLFHQLGVVCDRVENLDLHVVHLRGADRVKRNVVGLGNPVAVDQLGAFIDRIGDLFGRWAAIRGIVLDAEILVRPARIMARREDDAAEGLVFADHVGSRRRRQDAALADHHLAEAVGSGHLDRGLDHLAVEITAVAADHQGLALEVADGIEDRLYEILRVTRLGEDRHLLAQAGRAGLLVVEGCGRNCHAHGFDTIKSSCL